MRRGGILGWCFLAVAVVGVGIRAVYYFGGAR